MKNRISFKPLPMKTKLGIYIHIPFCSSKCAYCDFYSITPSDILIKEYIEALKLHIAEYSNICTEYIVDSIYFGGGTPSLIGENNIITILKTIKSKFKVEKDVEVTVEANPDSINKKFLTKIYKSGVNRLSIGIQSANNDNLINLSRRHNFEQAVNAVELSKKVGFSNISVDLMYGLSGQTLDMLKEELQKFIALDVSHISTYNLKLEEGTPMYEEEIELPSDDDVSDMYIEIKNSLEKAGYLQYEISNFSKPNLQSRHNSKYWDLSEYIGFGPSAHSFLGNMRFFITHNVKNYINGVKNRENIMELEDESAFIERHGEYIMLKLRTTQGISEKEFNAKFSASFETYEKRMQKYLASGHMEHNGDRWSLTTEGFLLSNTIIGSIIHDD